jgi:outer membrane protein with glycine zipper
MKKMLMPSFSTIIGVALFVAALATLGLGQSAPQGAGQQSAATQAQPPVGQSPAAAKLGAYVYPRNNQGAAQQQKDETECYTWAKQQTGIDPDAPAPAPQQAQQAKGGGAKGAAGGAAGGAAIGAIAGDAGTGAAIGATAGAVRGRRQQKKANKQAEQQAQQQSSAQRQAALAKVKSAFSSCIDARGYSVK